MCMSFSIGEISKIVGLPSSTLRYYEKEGLVTPNRDKNNLRVYGEDEVKWIKFLLHLKSAGLSVEELKQYTSWRTTGDSTIANRIDLLKEKKELLEKEIKERHSSLDIVTNKILLYEAKLEQEFMQK